MSSTPKPRSEIALTFRELSESSPEAKALIADDRDWTRQELWNLSSDVSGTLASAGLRAGALVAVRMRNSAAFVASVLALFRNDMILLPIDRDAKDVEVDRITETFGANALLTGDGLPRVKSLSHRSLDDVPTLTRVIKLTSGSTGQPRGVATTEENLLADARAITHDMQIGPDDINFGAIPLSHSYGFSNLVMPLLVQGTPIVLSNDYLPLSMIALANRTGCTVLPGVPMMFELLAGLPKSDGTFETVRTFISAGAPLRESTARRFNERHGAQISTFYGCSECGGISYDRLGGATARGTVGKPMTGVGIEIDPTGRLVVSGPAVALGYVNASPEERERLRDGVFRAEDLIDITGGGEIVIRGRASDLINVAGRKVNPREIEAVILEMPQVRDVRVTGFDGGARGDVIAAIIEGSDLTVADVRTHCAEQLASHKLPRKIKIVDALPRDQRGKIRQIELRKLTAEDHDG